LRKEYPSIEIESVSVKFSDSTDETKLAKKISEKFQTNHHVLEINNFLEELPKSIGIVQQPFWDLHWYHLVKKLKKLSNVFVSGDGGDELFAGYTFRYKKFLEQTTDTSTEHEKIVSYLNCHERDWTSDQELIFGKNCTFSWNEIYEILKPYFNNSLPRLSQVILADLNGKLRFNMIPLYNKIHEFFKIKNFSPFLSKELMSYSTHISLALKYNQQTNTGKLILIELLKRNKIHNLISQKKQGFSVNTINLWKNYGQKITEYYLENARIVENDLINKDWIIKYIKNSEIDVRIINKFLGLLALEIWYRIFVTKEMNSDEKLTL